MLVLAEQSIEGAAGWGKKFDFKFAFGITGERACVCDGISECSELVDESDFFGLSSGVDTSASECFEGGVIHVSACGGFFGELIIGFVEHALHGFAF